MVVDAVSGVEVGTELAWEYARASEQPIMVVINKMDRENADFDGVLEQLRSQFEDYKFIPVMLPLGPGSGLHGRRQCPDPESLSGGRRCAVRPAR